MEHEEDALLIAVHEAQMALTEAARPLQALHQEMQQLRHEVRQLPATRRAPLPSWGLVVAVGLGALLLGLVGGVAWSTWDLEARLTRALTDSLRQQVQPPPPPIPPPRPRPR